MEFWMGKKRRRCTETRSGRVGGGATMFGTYEYGAGARERVGCSVFVLYGVRYCTAYDGMQCKCKVHMPYIRQLQLQVRLELHCTALHCTSRTLPDLLLLTAATTAASKTTTATTTPRAETFSHRPPCMSTSVSMHRLSIIRLNQRLPRVIAPAAAGATYRKTQCHACPNRRPMCAHYSRNQ